MTAMHRAIVNITTSELFVSDSYTQTNTSHTFQHTS